jgi:hypothetical protein
MATCDSNVIGDDEIFLFEAYPGSHHPLPTARPTPRPTDQRRRAPPPRRRCRRRWWFGCPR